MGPSLVPESRQIKGTSGADWGGLVWNLGNLTSCFLAGRGFTFYNGIEEMSYQLRWFIEEFEVVD